MSPFNCEEKLKPYDNNYWYLDEKQGYWKPVTRKSSFSDINQIALSYRKNSQKVSGYIKEFRSYLKYEKKRLARLERQRRYQNAVISVLSWIWRNTFRRIREDWLCLALLGIFMALLSVGVDKGIELCSSARIWFYRDLTTSPLLSYIGWIIIPTILILFAVTFVKLLSPQSVGSGIPEVKTLLRGFPIENHLTFKTLIAKVIGLTATLGSGLPLGKEAPFVHISCIVARLITKIMSSIKGTYKDDTYNTETLVAGCAVGISACFASPIGGVLYSIEATSTYFAVRNYWRVFFAAVCSAVVFRLHAVWSKESETITALFATNFTTDFPFDPQELFIFALIGAICGILSSLWVWFFRQYCIFIKTNRFVSKIIQTNFLLYPTIVVVVVSFITYPFGFCHVAGHLSTHDQMTQLFSNFTWSQPNLTEHESNIVANWTTGNTNVITNLIGYFLYTFFFSVIASTIAVPSGTFIPVLKLGACLGRLIGESIHLWFPFGVYFSERLSPVIPGGYAVVGAVAFAGAATHTLSVSVMALEMTGQITLIAPIMIALLISNAIAVHLCPSIYDTIISLKKLPYLPELLPSKLDIEKVTVKDFMAKDVNYIWHGMNYSTLQTILTENEDLQHLPLVESQDTMKLLGSVERKELIKIIAGHISREKRLEVATRWQNELNKTKSLQSKEDSNKQNESRRPSRIELTEVVDESKCHQVTNDENVVPYAHGDVVTVTSISEFSNNSVTAKSTPFTRTNSQFRSTFNSCFQYEKESTNLLHKSNSTTSSPSQERVIDMAPKDQKRWEIIQLNEVIDFDYADIKIDLAPFQLVDRTPISKVHRLFTILSLRRAYVTQFGRLVGVVSLNELRASIDDVNNGNLMTEYTDLISYPEVKSQCLLQNSLLPNADNGQFINLDTPPDSACSLSNDVEQSKLINLNC